MFNIGARIKELRKLNNVTTTELSNKIGISQAQLSRIENNVNTAQFDTVMKICEIFSITLSEFFNDKDDLPIPEHFKKFIQQNIDLTPEQLQKLTEFLKTF